MLLFTLTKSLAAKLSKGISLLGKLFSVFNLNGLLQNNQQTKHSNLLLIPNPKTDRMRQATSITTTGNSITKTYSASKRKISFGLFVLMLLTAVSGWGQTNPAVQTLPYSQNFSSLSASSNAYPAGWQGWELCGNSCNSTSFRTNAPTANSNLLASSSASTNTGGIHNYNGKIGLLSSNSVDASICLAINTTGKTNILVGYDIMNIRNPYDGSGNTRFNEVTLQYRVGTSGSFTTISGNEYQNNTTIQTTAVTTPQNSISKSVYLPVVCNNQSVVQIRWAQRDVTGSGSKASFAVDNINIDQSLTSLTCQTSNAGASTYASSWTNGQNDNTTGFGNWNLSSFGSAGFFVGNSTGNASGTATSNINTSNRAWGMFSNSGGGIANAVRPFTSTLNVGGTLSFSMDNGFINNGSTVGISLQNGSNNNLMEFYFLGGSLGYSVSDGTGTNVTIIPFTGNGLDLTITRTGTGTYNLTVLRKESGVLYSFSRSFNNPASGQEPSQIRFFNANAGNGTNFDAYFNNLNLCTSCPTAPTANAGPSQTVCAGGFVTLAGSISGGATASTLFTLN